eukprot:GEMP01010595.1.p1 GENE.GEMP01010595.1~~GEMP01010595.1.p1  ORF type:complete len:519 (-),score=133.33 GEMP01010595.1:1605-3161(-)
MDFLRRITEKTMQHFFDEYALFDVLGVGVLGNVKLKREVNKFSGCLEVKAGYAERVRVSPSGVRIEDVVIVLGPRWRKMENAEQRLQIVEDNLAAQAQSLRSMDAAHPLQQLLGLFSFDFSIVRLRIRYEEDSEALTISVEQASVTTDDTSVSLTARGVCVFSAQQSAPIIPHSLMHITQHAPNGIFDELSPATLVARVKSGSRESYRIVHPLECRVTVRQKPATESSPPWQLSLESSHVSVRVPRGGLYALCLPRVDWADFDGIRPLPMEGVRGRWRFLRDVVLRQRKKTPLAHWLVDRSRQRRYVELYERRLRNTPMVSSLFDPLPPLRSPSAEETRELHTFEQAETLLKVARLRVMAERQLCFRRDRLQASAPGQNDGSVVTARSHPMRGSASAAAASVSLKSAAASSSKALWVSCEPPWKFGEMDLRGNLSRTWASIPPVLRDVELCLTVDHFNLHIGTKHVLRCGLQLPSVTISPTQISCQPATIVDFQCDFFQTSHIEFKVVFQKEKRAHLI